MELDKDLAARQEARELARQAEAIVAAHAVVGVEDGVALPEGLTYLFALPVLD